MKVWRHIAPTDIDFFEASSKTNKPELLTNLSLSKINERVLLLVRIVLGDGCSVKRIFYGRSRVNTLFIPRSTTSNTLTRGFSII